MFENVFADNRNIIIAILSILVILAILDVNLFLIIGSFIQLLSDIFMPFIRQILSLFGYASGTILNKTAGLASDTAKLTIDVAEGTVQSVGGLLQKASVGGLTQDMKKSFNSNFDANIKDVPPSSTTNPIHSKSSSKRSGFCYIGEFQGRRNCIELSQGQQCMSQQVFPTQKMCLNPTMTPNLLPQKPEHQVARHQL